VLLAVVGNLRAAGGLSGGREKGTWGALLLGGMTGGGMIRGKVAGILDLTRAFLFAYGLPAPVFAAAGGGLSFLAPPGALTLAWPLMSLSGAVALERSTRYASPWKSMTDALVVTTLLIVGLIYGSMGPYVYLLMLYSVPKAAVSTAFFVLLAGALLIYV